MGSTYKNAIVFLVYTVILTVNAAISVGDSIIASTYFGASGIVAKAMTRDNSGNVYIVGSTGSGLPVTATAFDKQYNLTRVSGGQTFIGSDAFVIKLSSNFQSVLACTYLGGLHDDVAEAVSVDPASGDIFVAGETYSKDFPVTPSGYDTTHDLKVVNGNAYSYGYASDVFVVRMSSDLSTIVAGTYIGGDSTDIPRSMSINATNGHIYIAGYTLSSNFPTTAGAFSSVRGAGNTSSFVACLSNSLDTLVHSTYMAPCGINAMALNNTGEVWIGGSAGEGLQTHISAYNRTPRTQTTASNAFVARLSSDLSSMIAATYIGSSAGDEVQAMALDNSGGIYISGNTLTNDYPVTSGAYNTKYSGGYEVFISHLNSSLSNLISSTFLFSNTTAGRQPESRPVKSMSIDADGNIVISATINLSSAGLGDIPLVRTSYDRSCGTDGKCNYDLFTNDIKDDAYLAKLNSSLTTLNAATFFGGSSYDRNPLMMIEPNGKIVICMYTSSDSLPLQTGSYQKTKSSAYIARFDESLSGYPAPEVPILVSPVDSAIKVDPDTTTLLWHPAADAISYQATIAVLSNNTTVFDTTVTDTFVRVSKCTWDTKYIWKIKAKNDKYESAYKTRIFTTAPVPLPIPTAPTLTSPANKSKTMNLYMTFYWKADSVTHSHMFQLSTDSTFATNLVVNKTNHTSDNYSFSGLEYGTNYFWRVKAYNYTGEGPWSEVYSFHVLAQPTVPVPVSPANGSTDVNVYTTLSWHPSTDAQSYEVRIATIDKTLDLMNSRSISTSDTFLIFSTRLLSKTQYHWIVNSSNNLGSSTFSSEMKFTTGSIAIPTPKLSQPSNGAVNQLRNTTLNWDTVTIAASYALQVSTSTDFTQWIVDQTNVMTNYYTLSATSTTPLTTYYWRVACRVDGNNGPWSEVRSFTTVPAASGAPVLVSPSYSAKNISLTPVLQWDTVTGASTYRVQVSSNSLFSDTIIDDSTLTVNSKTIGPLANKTTYYWRVNSKNSGGKSAWSGPWSFTTVPQIPSAATLLLPSVAVVINTDSTIFSWSKLPFDIDRYHLEIAADSNMSAIFLSDTSITDTFRLVKPLQNNKHYWWRVKAHNISGWGNFSGKRDFTVLLPITSVLPEHFTFSFTRVTGNSILKYALPKISNVSVKLFTIQGKLVKNISNMHQSPGIYEIKLNRPTLSKGYYLIDFKANDFRVRKKIDIFE